MKRATGILIAIALTVVLLYVSRFWIWQAPWGNDGLFAVKALSPRGNVVGQLVRGSPFAVFDVVVWFAVAVVSLSGLQWLYDRIAK